MTPQKMEEELGKGWDNFIEVYEKEMGSNFYTQLYWYAYKFMENNDPDGGVCFTIRQDAISNLL